MSQHALLANQPTCCELGIGAPGGICAKCEADNQLLMDGLDDDVLAREGLTKLVKGKFTKGPYNIVWGNPVEIYDGDQLLAAIPHHPRGEHTPNACLFNEAPQMFADLNIFCKLLDEFYPENIYAGENFDEFVAVHAALRHAKATLLRANGGTEGAISH